MSERKKEGRERKERVIHARIPEDLDEQIKEKAEGLGLSVSHLVRSVLQNAFGLVEDIVTDGANIARAARGERPVVRRAEVVAWQEAILAVNAVCEVCNAVLARGHKAAVGIATRADAPRRFRCTGCIEVTDEPIP